MSLIDNSYFQFELSAPRITDAQIAILSHYIDKTEKEILIKALGVTLYNEFIAGIAEEEPAQKWINIRDGANYDVTDNDGNTIAIHWNGLINSEKESLLAYFTYYNLVLNSQVSYGLGGGVSTENSENSIKVPARHLLVARQNRGVELYGNVPAYCANFDHNLLNFNVQDYQLSYDKNWMLQPSLFNFLYFANLAEPTTYQNWYFTGIKRINIFGI